MLLVWKGGSYEVNLAEFQIPLVIVMVGMGFGLFVGTFFVPWLYRVVVKEDWRLKWYHIFLGPLLLRRGPVPPPPRSYTQPVQDYYQGHSTQDDINARRVDLESRDSNPSQEEKDLSGLRLQI